jgi:hypothetical protein
MTWHFRHAEGCECPICSHRRRVAAIMRRDFRPGAQQTGTAASAETPEPGTEPAPVPDGTVSEVLAWVDEDAEHRTQAAYDHEQSQAGARVTLLAELEARGAVPAGDGGAE